MYPILRQVRRTRERPRSTVVHRRSAMRVNMNLRVPRVNTLRRWLWELADAAVDMAYHRWMATEADSECTSADVARARANYDRLYERAATRAAIAWQREQRGAPSALVAPCLYSRAPVSFRRGRQRRSARRRGTRRGSTSDAADGNDRLGPSHNVERSGQQGGSP
jgi:hypothetical protein